MSQFQVKKSTHTYAHTHTHTSYTKHWILRLSQETSKITENMIISCWKYRDFNYDTNDNNYNWHGSWLIQLKIVYDMMYFLSLWEILCICNFFNLALWDLKRSCLLSWEKVDIIIIRLLANQALTCAGCMIISL